MATLTLDNLSKTFPGDIRAVEQLTLEVANGELLVLFGPSGCGKTTTLRMIAGFEKVTQGTVAIGGRVVNGTRPKDRDVAMVFQQPALFPHMSVAGNLEFGLKMRRIRPAEIQQRVAGAAKLLRIESLLGRRPGQLSGGQRQRVALGRAIVRKPSLFLLDEPLASLDENLRDQLRDEIQQLHGRLGITTVYVTHDQTEAMTLAGRIAVLERGKLQQLADPATIYARPANRFVAGLVGRPAMNFVAGRIGRDESGLTFQAESLSIPLPATIAGSMEPYASRPVTLGVRPEYVGPLGTELPPAVRIAAIVRSAQPLGMRPHVQFDCGGHRLTGRLDPGNSIRTGDRVELTVATKHLVFFDSETGRAIR